MISRREFLQVAAATAALVPGGWTRAFAQQRLTQDRAAAARAAGRQRHPRPPHRPARPAQAGAVSRAVGQHRRRRGARASCRTSPARRFSTCSRSRPARASAYAFTAEDFAALAQTYGRLGGLDRIATVLKSIRAERPDRTLFLDGGDTWQNSYTSLVSKGQDMVDCMALLKPDAMTGHWEFTLGAERVKEITKTLGFPFLAQNIRDTEWNEAGVRADGDVRARRRQGRGDRPGLPLHADRQPALDDPELVVRHPRGGFAEPTSTRRGRRARSSWCCCRTTASTSTASSPRA